MAEKGMKREDMERSIEFYKSQTELLRSISKSGVLENLTGFRGAIGQVIPDWKTALFTPFAEKMTEVMSPLIIAMQDVMGSVSEDTLQSMQPTFEALASVLDKIAPTLNAIVDFLEGGFTSGISPEYRGGDFTWTGAAQGAVTYGLVGGLIGGRVFGTYGAIGGAVAGGIYGFVTGGWF